MQDEPIRVAVDEAILELVPGFLSNRRGDVEAIRAALAGGDWERIRLLAHSMKGAGGGYGFDRITEIGAAMEAATGRRDTVEVEQRVCELRDYLARVQVVPFTDG